MGDRLRRAVFVLAAAVALATAAGAQARAKNGNMPALDKAVLAQINTFRIAHGLVPLSVSRELAAAAAEHSRQMAVDGYFSHDSADGRSATRRIRRYYPVGRSTYWSVGENLLWASPTISAAGALRAWIASPPHLRNLLDPSWRRIGIAAYHSSSAPGVYHHHAVTVITTDFGVRR